MFGKACEMSGPIWPHRDHLAARDDRMEGCDRRRSSFGLTSKSLKVPGSPDLNKSLSKSANGLNRPQTPDLRRATLSKMAFGSGEIPPPLSPKSGLLTVPGQEYHQARRNSDSLLKVEPSYT